MVTVCPEGNERRIMAGPIILIVSLSITAGGRRIPVKYLTEFTIISAKTAAIIPDHTRSGLFLIKRNMNMLAGKVSPKKVRLAQIKGFVVAAKELMVIKRDLLIPDRRTIIKPSRNTINTIKLILYGEFIM